MAASTTSSSSSASALTTLTSSPSSAPPRQPPAMSPQKTMTPLHPLHTSSSFTSAYSRKIARNVMAMATGEAPAEVAAAELPDIIKPLRDAWDKVEDKYAISSLAVACLVALWGSTGMISAIDRLPLIPGALELVGIGYTGWFAYKNLIFKPDREALIWKIREIYDEVTGSS